MMTSALTSLALKRCVLSPASLSALRFLPRVSAFTTSPSPFAVINIQDEEDFKKRVVDSSVPVVVDFHAEWCDPCKILGPRLEAAVDSCGKEIVMAKVNIDAHQELAMAFKVRAVPTVVAVKAGKVVDGFTGVKDEDQLKTFVDNLARP